MIDFLASQTTLQEIFKVNNFDSLYGQGGTCTVPLQKFSNGAIISATFPGYKTQAKGGKITIYDYRMDWQLPGQDSIPLSHIHLIVDIYNKSTNGYVSAADMDEFIQSLYKDRTNVDEGPLVTSYSTQTPPTAQLLQRVSNFLKSQQKSYDQQGNATDLGLFELIHIAKWIMVQEDINYPRAKGKQGRQMTLARYQEAVYVAHNKTHSLEEVILRAVTTGYPPSPWPEASYGKCS